MKLPSVYTDLCFNPIFENIATDSNSCCCSVVNGTSCKLRLLLTVPIAAGSRSHRVTCNMQFTGDAR